MITTADTPNRINDKQWVEENYNLPEFGSSTQKIYTIRGSWIYTHGLW